MRRFGAAVVAAVGLLAVSAVPASAQDLGDVDVFDLPQMGFAVSRDAGYPGDVVTGQVDVDDVAAYCLSMEELVGNVVNSVDPSLDAWRGSLQPADGGLTEEQVETFANAVETLRIGVQAFEETAMQFWLETFVFTFADPVTQELLGETGNFDPSTGQGSVVVPHVDPGVYGVAAACVQLQSAGQLLDGGYDAGGHAFWAWVDENNVEIPEFDILSDEWQDFVEASALEWVPEMITPRAVGIDVFCVLTPDGMCGDEAVGDDGLLDDGPVLEPLEDLGPPAAAPVVQTTPRFTG